MKNLSIGVDLGGTKILAGVINTDTGEVLATAKKKTKKSQGQQAILERIKKCIYSAIEKAELSAHEISSIGIGAAGQVNRKDGILISAPNLDCVNLQFRKEFEHEFSLPTYIGNDVEVATIGEHTFGAGIGYKSMVCIFVGTGIGSGIIHDSKIYHGFTGTAGEIGHITVHPNGRMCGCGSYGCLEAYASRTAISRKIASSIKKGHPSTLAALLQEDPTMTIRSGHIKTALDEGDELTLTCINEAAEYLSAGISSVVNFYNPEMIILGGGLIDAVDTMFEYVQKKTRKMCLPVPSNSLHIRKALLGDNSGIVGAAYMAETKRKETL